MTEQLNISYLFDDYRYFPWDILGFTVPKVGPLHSYLTSILAPHAPSNWREFMNGTPSWREVERGAKAMGDGSVLVFIAGYCRQLYSMPDSERTDVAQEVLDFLREYQPFRQRVQETLDRMHREGLISFKSGVYR